MAHVRVSSAFGPSQGRGWVHRRAEKGDVVLLGSATRTGLDASFEDLGDPLFERMADAILEGRELPRVFAEAVVFLRRSSGAAPADDQLPSATVLLAVCRRDSLMLGWVGSHQAYLLRGRRIVAANVAHTTWHAHGEVASVVVQGRNVENPTDEKELRVELDPETDRGRKLLGMPTRRITPVDCEPSWMTIGQVQPGDRLLMLPGPVNSHRGFQPGVESYLASVDSLDPRTVFAGLQVDDPYVAPMIMISWPS